jgi:hypothetical protein
MSVVHEVLLLWDVELTDGSWRSGHHERPWLLTIQTRRNARVRLATDNVAPRGAGKGEPARQHSSVVNCGQAGERFRATQEREHPRDSAVGPGEDADDGADQATNEDKTQEQTSLSWAHQLMETSLSVPPRQLTSARPN